MGLVTPSVNQYNGLNQGPSFSRQALLTITSLENRKLIKISITSTGVKKHSVLTLTGMKKAPMELEVCESDWLKNRSAFDNKRKLT